MATCRDIVARALRMAGVVPRGDVPDATELRDGLIILQSIYMEWLTGGMFGRLRDVYEGGAYTAKEGERVFLDSGEVSLPPTVDDRKPRDLAVIEAHDTEGHRAWLWDRDQWVRIDTITADAVAPLSWRGENGLAAVLALRFAEEFTAPVTNAMMTQARSFKTALALKLGSDHDRTGGEWF